MGGKLQDITDGLLLPWRAKEKQLTGFARFSSAGPCTTRSVLGEHLLERPFQTDRYQEWSEAVLKSADRILSGRLPLFDLEDLEVGGEIQWNYDYKAKKQSPLLLACRVDYRDYHSVGDCKFVWEPNRHQHWVVLGRAYRVNQEERYAQAMVDQFDSWTRQCPFGRGMNWRSPLELAIRLINWSWAFALIDDSPVMTDRRRERILFSVHQHLSEIARKFSRYSSANNHLVGEAAGVFIASSYFSGLKGAPGWRAKSREILAREIQRQTFEDGGTREQATGYHLFSLEFFLLAGLVGRNAGDDFSTAYWDRLEKMTEFVSAMSEGGRAMPMIGDADDGYVLDLGNRTDAAPSFVALGALLFHRSDFKAATTDPSENCYWLLGPDVDRVWSGIADADKAPVHTSRAFTESGYYLLQHGHRNSSDQTSVVVDCGPLGFLSIAAHGHADALSLILRVGGVDVLVDPGTYDYFTYPKWREYFRSTRAHNTIEIDGQNQSQMVGAFMWGRQAVSRCLAWEPIKGGGTVVAEHDGYRNLDDPVVHRRTVKLDGEGLDIRVLDELLMTASHDVAVFWHFAEQCTVLSQSDHGIEIDFGGGRLFMEFDPRLSLSQERGNEDSNLGWVSRGYHRKSPSLTLIGRCRCVKDTALHTRMRIERPESGDSGARAGTSLETSGQRASDVKR